MPESSIPPTHDYLEATFSLRAPRVAIVFPADTPQWDFFARSALWRANQLWGGAGFVLVPQREGLVSAAMLQAVAAYDPDYVVSHRVSWRELLTAYPAARSTVTGPDGHPLGLDALSHVDTDEPATDVYTEAARDLVAVACQVYRRRDQNSKPPAKHEPVRWDHAWGDPEESNMLLEGEHLTPTTALGVPDTLCLAAPPDLDGPWGLWTAVVCGVVERPALPGSEQDLTPDEAADLVGWFYERLDRRRRGPSKLPGRLTHHHAGLQIGADVATLPRGWDRTTSGLVSISDGSARPRATLVVGDTAEDFALALIYDRLWGNGLWISSEWGMTAPGKPGRRASAALRLLGYQGRHLSAAMVTSASVDQDHLDAVVEVLRPEDSPGFALADEDGTFPSRSSRRSPKSSNSKRQWTSMLPAGFDWKAKIHLAVTEEYSTRLTVPVVRDESATVLASTPPALRPSDPALAGSNVAWHVDLRLGGVSMPRGRGLDGHRLAATPDFEYETWIRSGNRGVSYESRKWDFVATGANTEQRLARPRVRFLTLHGWCRAVASQAGYDIGWSDAGRRSRLLEDMWGDRREMTADFSDRFTEMARLFTRKGKSSSAVYPNKDGVLVGGTGFLTFDAIRDVLVPPRPHSGPGSGSEPDQDVCAEPGLHPSDGAVAPAEGGENRDDREARTRRARAKLDQYLARGIVRRGLVLGCSTCEQTNFVPIDELGQRNVCARCGSFSALSVDAWRMPSSEPTWFYDLHPVARTFVADNGHAPAWLADYLAKQVRDYADCAELNLLKPGTRTSIAESDLIAHADGVLITAEVKTSKAIGRTSAERNAAAVKRVRWAAVLQAEEVLLATTEPAWEPSSVDACRTHLTSAINSGTFAPDRPPRLRVITGLGSDAHTDAYVGL